MWTCWRKFEEKEGGRDEAGKAGFTQPVPPTPELLTFILEVATRY